MFFSRYIFVYMYIGQWTNGQGLTVKLVHTRVQMVKKSSVVLLGSISAFIRYGPSTWYEVYGRPRRVENQNGQQSLRIINTYTHIHTHRYLYTVCIHDDADVKPVWQSQWELVMCAWCHSLSLALTKIQFS